MSKANRRIPGNQAPIVIKKEEVIEGEAHAGAWKVAYADFVTAMMAFFLLMWLLNATTEDQRKGLADYFSPNSLLSHASSGTGQPFGGHTAFDRGALVSDRGAVQALVGTRPTPLDPSDADANPDSPERAGSDDDQGPGADQQTPPLAPPPPGPTTTAAPPHPPPSIPAGGAGTAVATAQAGAPPGVAGAAAVSQTAAAQRREPTDAEIRAAQERREKAEFETAAQQLRSAVGSDPQLTELAKQLVIDMTPQGLRIQILDSEQRPMFPFGSAEPNDRAKLLLQKVAPVLMRLPQEISIAGNTDAAPFPGPDRTNWELSTERANATRRLLAEDGLPDARVRSVTGNADRDLLAPKDPLAAVNRRIAIIVLRGTGEAAPAPAPASASAPAPAPASAPAPAAPMPPGAAAR